MSLRRPPPVSAPRAAAVLERARPLGPAPVALPAVRRERPPARDDAPPVWERAFLIGALIAQQDAFLNLVRIARGVDAADPNGDVGATDPLSQLLVLLTLAGLAALSLRHRAAIGRGLARNGPSLLLALVIFLSAAWSVDPALSAKRALVYLVTLGLPFYMAARLPFERAMRDLALAFAIPAIASFLVGLLVPRIGVMHLPGVEGDWRGVFTHKNPLAQSMLFGVLVEAYLVAKGPRRALHLGVAGLELGLILLANSMTGVVVSAVGLAVFTTLALASRGGPGRRALTAFGPLAFAAAAAVVIFAPQVLEHASGRDATLTGRTDLWAETVGAIAERPVAGWGFQAFWLPDNPRAVGIWERIGWNAPNAHNGFLDVTLGLGPLGLALTLAVVGQALVRGGRLLRAPGGGALAGAAALALAGAVVFRSATEAVLARQSDIDWLLLNLASFMAMELWRELRPEPAGRRAAPAAPVLQRARPV